MASNYTDVDAAVSSFDNPIAPQAVTAFGTVVIPASVQITINNVKGSNFTITATSLGADVAGAAVAAQSYAVQRANHTGTQLISSIAGLQSVLDGKMAVGDGRVDTAYKYGYRDHIADATAAIDGRIAGKAASTTTLNLFSAGNLITGTGYVRNASLWCADVDLTCFSPWNSQSFNQQGGTLVTPRHVWLANHFSSGMVPGSTTIRFVGRSNTIYERTVAALTRISTSDVLIATLDSDLPSDVTPAQVLPTLPTGTFPAGTPVLMCEQGKRALVAENSSTVTGVDPVIIRAATATNRTAWTQTGPAVSGDSGSPVFFVLGGRAVLWFAFHYPTSGDIAPAQIAAVNAVLGSGYALSVASVPLVPRDPAVVAQGTNASLAGLTLGAGDFKLDPATTFSLFSNATHSYGLVANSLFATNTDGTLNPVSLGAGQSVRRKADDSGFEAYTPSTGEQLAGLLSGTSPAFTSFTTTGNPTVHGLNVQSDGIASQGNIVTSGDEYINGATAPTIFFGSSANLSRHGTGIFNLGTGARDNAAGTLNLATLNASGPMRTTSGVLINASPLPTDVLLVAQHPTGQGVVYLGGLAGASDYGAVSLTGSMAVGDYNFASSPTDKDFYVNRPAGHAINFKENNGATQMSLLAGGTLQLVGTQNLLPQSSTPAAPASGVTIYVDSAGDLHALHSNGTNHVLSAH